MISNQILQSTLDGLKQITRVDMCVVDTEGVMLASTFDGKRTFGMLLSASKIHRLRVRSSQTINSLRCLMKVIWSMF